MSLRVVAQQLVRQIQTIRKQDEAGLNPTNGEIRELYDLAARLDVEVQLDEPALPCAIAGCTRPAEHRIDGQPYCGRCGRALRAVTMQVRTDAAEIARTRLEAMVSGRTPWPVDDLKSAAPDTKAVGQ